MTQMTYSPTLAASHAVVPVPAATQESPVEALTLALLEAAEIPTTQSPHRTIAGRSAPAYGALIRFSTERFPGDLRGKAGAPVLVTYALPQAAPGVLARMLHEGRRVDSITAVRGVLAGTTTR
jgi:hypothetical protein